MIKMALHLLKLEKKSAVCLLFMEILKSPEISGNLDFLNIQFLYNALLTFFMIFMCVVLMVYSSNYFIRLKSREIGLTVLSGLSFFKRTIYSLVQVLCIVLFSSMIGIIVFLGISPIVKMVIYEILSVDANIFVLSFDALMQGLAVILAMILVIMLFNSGFIMRTGITELLENHNIISYKKDTRAIKPPDGIYPLIYIFGLICMYTGNNQVGGYILFSFFGAVGAYGVFRHYLPHHYNRNALKYCKTAKDLLIKEDVSLIMQQSKSFILILMVAMIGIVPFICGTTDNSLFNFEMHLAFVITNILLSLTLINRFKIDHIQRREHFHAIYQLGFARALISKPEIIIADEPTGNLDSNNSRELMELFSKINHDSQTTIIMVTHDAFVASYSTKMLYMKDGKIDKILNRHGLTRDEYFNEIVKVNAILSNN